MTLWYILSMELSAKLLFALCIAAVLSVLSLGLFLLILSDLQDAQKLISPIGFLALMITVVVSFALDGLIIKEIINPGK